MEHIEKMLLLYEKKLEEIKKKKIKIFFLKEKETLENFFISQNYPLIKK